MTLYTCKNHPEHGYWSSGAYRIKVDLSGEVKALIAREFAEQALGWMARIDKLPKGVFQGIGEAPFCGTCRGPLVKV